MKIKVGVIFGGQTVEHEISIITAVQAMVNMNQEKYDIHPIYIAKDGTWYTGKMLTDITIYRDFENLKKFAKKTILFNKNGSIVLQSLGLFKNIITDLDIIFPIVHGNNVEDGTIQGYLQTINAPFVGSNVLGAALGQDKVIMKQIFEKYDLPLVDYVWFYDNEYHENKEEIIKKINKLGYPIIIKPATLGSSIGINFVKDKNELEKAIADTITYDTKIVVEKAVENLTEINCSVLGNYQIQEASILEEVMSTEEFLTFNDKYVGDGKKTNRGSKGMSGAQRIIPARVDDKIKTQIQEISITAFKALNLSGVCRFDFLMDSKKEKIYLNEPNTIPGSLAFYLWEKTNKNYEKLLDEMISIGIKNYKIKQQKTVTFDNNILAGISGTKGLKGLKGSKK